MKKRILTLILCIGLLVAVGLKIDSITEYIAKYFNNTPAIALEKKNKYAKSENYAYVQYTDNFVPYNFQDLINIFYTVLDSGYDTFTFYCPKEYGDCISDIEKISDHDYVDVLTTIGNFISPYNNFTSLKVQYDTAGEVTIDVTHLYTEQDKINISNKIDAIWKELVTADMSTEDIIYAFHDYIINHTRYDENYEQEIKEKKTPTHQASKANGPLFEGYAICSGYTDVMAMVLDKLEVKNFKVASSTHVWNAVYLNDKWVHLDLTWDDPVSEDHTINNLLHKFFLIDTATLEEFDIKDHTFDKSIYLELK